MLFPPACAGCGSPGSHWCPDCRASVTLLRPENGASALALRTATTGRGAGGPTAITLGAAAEYRPPLSHALLELKYRPNRILAEQLAAIMAHAYRRAGWRASFLIPVPLGPARQRQRGFNQADLLARALGRRLALDVRADVLIRARETPSQVGLGPRERLRNVAGAFRARGHLGAQERPLIVDDLMTTGATLVACAQALQQGGAGTAYGLALAVARPQFSS